MDGGRGEEKSGEGVGLQSSLFRLFFFGLSENLRGFRGGLYPLKASFSVLANWENLKGESILFNEFFCTSLFILNNLLKF